MLVPAGNNIISLYTVRIIVGFVVYKITFILLDVITSSVQYYNSSLEYPHSRLRAVYTYMYNCCMMIDGGPQ